jgi:hypothetical protein
MVGVAPKRPMVSKQWPLDSVQRKRYQEYRIPAHGSRTMVHGSGARAGGFSSRLRKHREATFCNRPRRFLRLGLGLGFARQASRFGYQGTRTVGIGFRRRSKVAPQALVGATGAHTQRLRFYEDAAKVVQRRMVPNFKKSFERAVRTALR